MLPIVKSSWIKSQKASSTVALKAATPRRHAFRMSRSHDVLDATVILLNPFGALGFAAPTGSSHPYPIRGRRSFRSSPICFVAGCCAGGWPNCNVALGYKKRAEAQISRRIELAGKPAQFYPTGGLHLCFRGSTLDHRIAQNQLAMKTRDPSRIFTLPTTAQVQTLLKLGGLHGTDAPLIALLSIVYRGSVYWDYFQDARLPRRSKTELEELQKSLHSAAHALAPDHEQVFVLAHCFETATPADVRQAAKSLAELRASMAGLAERLGTALAQRPPRKRGLRKGWTWLQPTVLVAIYCLLVLRNGLHPLKNRKIRARQFVHKFFEFSDALLDRSTTANQIDNAIKNQLRSFHDLSLLECQELLLEKIEELSFFHAAWRRVHGQRPDRSNEATSPGISIGDPYAQISFGGSAVQQLRQHR